MSNLYEKNYCRFCSDLFCCEKCRLKHEKRVHSLLINCEICIYGKMYYKNVNSELQDHIKIEHLPVICLTCKKKFCDLTELTENYKCVQLYDSPINRHAESMIIAGNMETKFTNNKCALNLPSQNELVTSTPVGINEVHEITIDTLPLSSPPDEIIIEDDTSMKINNNRTPVDNQLQLNVSNNQLFPLVTPLRSIIAKSKSQCNLGENKRKVKFFDYNSATDLKSTNIHRNINEEIYSKKMYYSYDDATPSASESCETEEFYSPQNYSYERTSNPTEYEANSAAVALKKITDDQINTSAGIGNFWASMTSTIKQIFFHPPSNAICDASNRHYTDSSKSTKRLLSPNTQKQTPNIKRFCTRGRNCSSNHEQKENNV